MNKKVSYRAVLITGAGNGIGRQLAFLAANAGVAIAAIDLHGEGLQEVAAELAKRKQPFFSAIGDVTDAPALSARVQELEAQAGPIDLVIANAGIGIETSALDLNAQDMAKVINVNLLGVVNTMAAVLPGMLQRGRGHLVGLSSLASYKGLPGMLAYCASKSGVNAILEATRLEVEPRGLHVTTICPGWIRTAMTEPLHQVIPQMLRVEVAAAEIWRAIINRKRFHAFPPSMVWQARLMNWLPRCWGDAIICKMFNRIPHLKPHAHEKNQ